MIVTPETFASAKGVFKLDLAGEFFVGPASAPDERGAVSVRQTGGGKPAPSYTANAMANDLDAPRAVVVVYPDHVEKWIG